MGEEEQSTEESIEKKKFSLLDFYEKQYKKLLIIPFAMFILAIISLFVMYATTGDFINRGVTLKGGLTVTIPSEVPVNTDDFEKELSSQFPKADISARILSGAGKQVAISVAASDIDEKALIAALKEKFGDLGDYNVETTGSSIGKSFFKETLFALLAAFAFMGIVIFLYFRVPIPSIAVILSAFSDIIVTVAIVNLLGVKISTAGIAAFLMLIGYSVDTDVLLSTRILKAREGSVFERSLSAMRTGLTMTFTTIVVVLVTYFIAQPVVIKQIALIIFIGLLVDLVNTWIMNTGILRWYLEEYKPAKARRVHD